MLLLRAGWATGERLAGLRSIAAPEAEVLLAVEQTQRIAEEQAALRRVAMLVARPMPPEGVFAAVTAEVGLLLGTDFCVLGRYDDRAATIVGAWTRAGVAVPTPVVGRVELGGHNVTTTVFETGGPARLDTYANAWGTAAEVGRGWGLRSVVGVPVSVDGHLWGVIVVGLTHAEPLPADTEKRLAGFTELVATAIANTHAREELRRFAEEQAALRRVAMLVARAAPAAEVFAAVASEVGRLFAADMTVLSRYDPGGTTVVGVWSETRPPPVPVGTRARLGGRNVSTLVLESGRPARMDDYADSTGAVGDVARQVGVRGSVAVPISVEDRLWGVMIVASGRALMPAETPGRLAGFTELVATAIANAQARMQLRGFADEQAALRRVATVVAQSARSEQVFAAVASEVGQLLQVDFAVLSRYDSDGAATVVGRWAGIDDTRRIPVGDRMELGGRNVTTQVFRTGRAARMDDYSDASGEAGVLARDRGIRSIVGAPIIVAGRLWGVIMTASATDQQPADTAGRLAGFTELVATALANADAQSALSASRARIVAAADATRRRIERDLHDGAQQRLVSLALRLRAAQAATPPETGELAARLGLVADGLTGVLDELRDIARGLHPSILAEGGLRPALKALARRSAVAVRLDLQIEGRFPEPIEMAAYYMANEALANVAKHAAATVVDLEVTTDADWLSVHVRDDGSGGADLTRGTGLIGVTDRAAALGGRFDLHSPRGDGTTVSMSLPLSTHARATRHAPSDLVS